MCVNTHTHRDLLPEIAQLNTQIDVKLFHEHTDLHEIALLTTQISMKSYYKTNRFPDLCIVA